MTDGVRGFLDSPRIRGLEEIPGRGTDGARPSDGAEFGNLLRDAIERVDALQKDGEAATMQFVRGEDVDLHEVLIKVEEADLAFKTMMEVRNKLLQAYQEIMRMA